MILHRLAYSYAANIQIIKQASRNEDGELKEAATQSERSTAWFDKSDKPYKSKCRVN